jgi:hypothetical protein
MPAARRAAPESKNESSRNQARAEMRRSSSCCPEEQGRGIRYPECVGVRLMAHNGYFVACSPLAASVRYHLSIHANGRQVHAARLIFRLDILEPLRSVCCLDLFRVFTQIELGRV